MWCGAGANPSRPSTAKGAATRTRQQAAAVIGDPCPDREIVPWEIHAVVEGGGGIHCVTQQQPKAREGRWFVKLFDSRRG
ncbi:agmatine deiminase family protein [Streptomyces actuosus]|uniref:Agmatine deiminase family protein n=1 Tax=Streptomyces actuosus TaxID=1885 RepID=A0ABS2VZL2_STRAS|nr:agmatine deiminase family protein [Streptomyces actuosus]